MDTVNFCTQGRDSVLSTCLHFEHVTLAQADNTLRAEVAHSKSLAPLCYPPTAIRYGGIRMHPYIPSSTAVVYALSIFG